MTPSDDLDLGDGMLASPVDAETLQLLDIDGSFSMWMSYEQAVKLGEWASIVSQARRLKSIHDPEMVKLYNEFKPHLPLTVEEFMK